MRNARKTVALAIKAIAQTQGAGFIGGDESDPTIKYPCVSLEWLRADLPSAMLPGQRMRLVQVEVGHTDRKTDATEAIADAVLEGLGFAKNSTNRIACIPNQSWAISGAGAAVGTPLGHKITLRPQLGQGWQNLKPPQKNGRRLAITLEVHYSPS